MKSKTKICKRCRETKPVSSFSKDTRYKDGYYYYCRMCKNEIGKNYRERLGKREIKNRTLQDRYGITINEYDKLLDMQNHCCAICQKHITETGQGLHVDHCHITGRIRGLLCNSCNGGLGNFKDDTSLLESAIEYLKGCSD